MVRTMVRQMILAAALSCLAVLPQAAPAESPGTPEARASFDAGRAADRSGDPAKAAALFRKAIDLDPRFVDAHDEFISATEAAAYAYDGAKRSGDEAARKRATRELETLYQGWAKAHPDMAVYEWALSQLAGKDWTAAERHLTRATAISPAFARPYQDLALIAELRGDNAGRLGYLKKAADLNPADASYFFYYASAMKSVDPAASLELLQEVATRFPASDRGAQGLYWAAYETPGLPAKIAIYERLLGAPIDVRYVQAGERVEAIPEALLGLLAMSDTYDSDFDSSGVASEFGVTQTALEPWVRASLASARRRV